jgi:simple sugar transport system ATP-binding protein
MSLLDYAKCEITLPELTGLMAGGAELEQLALELERESDPDAAAVGEELLVESKILE